jgi:hypothetical protein
MRLGRGLDVATPGEMRGIMSDDVRGRAFPIRGAVVAFAALAFAACGGTSTPAADASTDVGAGDSASPHGGSATVDAATGDGRTIRLQAFGGGPGEVAAQVSLAVEAGGGPQMTCSAPLAAGACQLISCQLGGIVSPAAGKGNFGPLSASVGATTVPLTYDGIGYPTVYFPSSITLGTGGTMTFHGGNGADVPKFDVPATIPGLAVLTAPVPATDGGAATIDTSRNLSVTWSPISIGQIQFRLSERSTSVGGVAIDVSCTFEGASGSGVVSHALLSTLKEMSGTNPTYAYVSSYVEATTVVGGLTLVMQSFQSSATVVRSFEVTLQ